MMYYDKVLLLDKTAFSLKYLILAAPRKLFIFNNQEAED